MRLRSKRTKEGISNNLGLRLGFASALALGMALTFVHFRDGNRLDLIQDSGDPNLIELDLGQFKMNLNQI